MSVEPESQVIEPFARAAAVRAGGSPHPIREASLRLAELRDGRSAFKARDLVGLLLSHGARAYRAAQPATVTRLRVSAPNGTPAVRLRLV